MKVLIVTYKCKPGKREAFLEAVRENGAAQKSREEAGNIRYAYARATDDEDILYLLEQWESEEAFESHKAADHFRELGELKQDYVEDTILEMYEG